MATLYIFTRAAPSANATVVISTSVSRNISTVPSPVPTFLENAPTVRAVLGALSNFQQDPGGSAGAAAGATGLGKQFSAAQKGLTAEAYKSCGLCPDSIVNMIASEVREVSEMILRVKRLTRLLNKILEGAEQAILEFINGFIDLIPYPPLLDLREIVRTIMCPLTPQAFVVGAYQKGIAAAHKLASSTVPFGSLNPAYYPVLASSMVRYSVQEGAAIVTGAVNVVEKLVRQWAGQWRRMAEEFWRRFMEYLDTQNPFTDFGSGGSTATGGTNADGGGKRSGGKFLKVASLAEVTAPTEGMVVYIESPIASSNLSGSSRTQYGQYSTVDNPMFGTERRNSTSAEDRAVEGAAQGMFQRQRYVFRDGEWVALSDSSVKKFVKLLFRVLMEFYSVVRNVGYFALRASVTKASVALVRATCPAVYNSASYPFKRYDELTRDFKMQGFVPSGLGSSSRPFVDAGMRLMLKIESWTAASYIAVI